MDEEAGLTIMISSFPEAAVNSVAPLSSGSVPSPGRGWLGKGTAVALHAAISGAALFLVNCSTLKPALAAPLPNESSFHPSMTVVHSPTDGLNMSHRYADAAPVGRSDVAVRGLED